MKIRIRKHFLASMTVFEMNLSVEAREGDRTTCWGLTQRERERNREEITAFLLSLCRVSSRSVSVCELKTLGKLVSLLGFECVGGRSVCSWIPCKWRVIGEVLELFRKVALKASKWRDDLALSEKNSIKSTTGHQNSLFHACCLGHAVTCCSGY